VAFELSRVRRGGMMTQDDMRRHCEHAQHAVERYRLIAFIVITTEIQSRAKLFLRQSALCRC
jgi:hypothetical protein